MRKLRKREVAVHVDGGLLICRFLDFGKKRGGDSESGRPRAKDVVSFAVAVTQDRQNVLFKPWQRVERRDALRRAKVGSGATYVVS